MKTYTFPTCYLGSLLLGALLTGCTASTGYTIQGSTDPHFSRTVYLLSATKEKTDTLAWATVVKGKFELKGVVEGVKEAILLPEGLSPTQAFYLENSNYTVTLDTDNPSQSLIQGGGASQQAAVAMAAINNQLNQGIDLIRDEYMAALRNADTIRYMQLSQHLDSLQQSAEEQRASLLQQYANSYFALKHLATVAPRLPLDELRERFARLDKSLQKCSEGQAVSEQIKRMEALLPGQVAPDYSLQSPDGSSFTLHSIQAKLKLYDFWASWCGPCRALLPSLRQLYSDYHRQGIEVIGISLDENKGSWEKAIEEEKMDWPQGSDLQGFTPNSELVQLYNIYNGIPHFVLVDAQQRIVATGNDFQAIRAIITEMMNEK